MEGINHHIIDYKGIQKDLTFDYVLAKKMLNQYFSEEPTIEHLYGGFRNRSAVVTVKSSKYVLRIYSDTEKNSNHTEDGLLCEWDFVSFLEKNDIPVPTLVLNNRGSRLTTSGNVYAVLMNYIEGTDGRNSLNNIKFENLGKVLGKVHSLSPSYVTSYKRSVPFANQIDYLKSKIDASDQDLQPILEKLSNKYANVLNNINKLPKHFIHGDFIFSNLLFRDDNVAAILDFDDMHEGILIREVSSFIISAYDHHALYQVTNSYIESFMDSYTKVRPLLDLEKELSPLYLEISQLGLLRTIQKYRPELRARYIKETDEIIKLTTEKYLT